MTSEPSTPLDPPAPLDPFGADTAAGATGLLRDLNLAGELSAADVHVAQTVARLCADTDEAVLLALALTVRGVRLGSSRTDLLAVLSELASPSDDDVTPPAWRAELEEWLADPDAWWSQVEAAGVASGEEPLLVLERPFASLRRFHRLEVSLAERMAERFGLRPPTVDDAALDADLDRLFDSSSTEQRGAAKTAARSWTSILTGGPGTGKTTTIARLLVALDAAHRADTAARPLVVGLAAPTGKAAARMRQAITAAARSEREGFSTQEREWLSGLPAVTLHRLLGPRPDHRTTFVHHGGQRLPYDVVVVDETSMVSLLMMERLVQAVSPRCRLVLVGDAEQLASVEAGAVLRDVIDGLEASEERSAVTRLRRGFRFSGALGALADAVVAGDVQTTLGLLAAGGSEGVESGEQGMVRRVDPEDVADVVAGEPLDQAREVLAAAARGQREEALERLGQHRLLCAHRDGPLGVSTWNEWIERHVRTFADPARPWFVGRPVMMTRNDTGLGINNGDSGVTLDVEDRLTVVFEDGRQVAAARLGAAQTSYAVTVHRSQGSEFDSVTLVLPEADAPINTRELLYTAITRARRRLTVVGSEEAVAAAVSRRTARASGVAHRLADTLARGGVDGDTERDGEAS